jgi:hypothetical protein
MRAEIGLLFFVEAKHKNEPNFLGKINKIGNI